jgi:hypothetical protein
VLVAIVVPVAQAKGIEEIVVPIVAPSIVGREGPVASNAVVAVVLAKAVVLVVFPKL